CEPALAQHDAEVLRRRRARRDDEALALLAGAVARNDLARIDEAAAGAEDEVDAAADRAIDEATAARIDEQRVLVAVQIHALEAAAICTRIEHERDRLRAVAAYRRQRRLCARDLADVVERVFDREVARREIRRAHDQAGAARGASDLAVGTQVARGCVETHDSVFAVVADEMDERLVDDHLAVPAPASDADSPRPRESIRSRRDRGYQ